MENLIFSFQFSTPAALGIGAASFASVWGQWDSGTGMGLGNGNLGVGRNDASKDIAESPAALPNAQRKFIVHGL